MKVKSLILYQAVLFLLASSAPSMPSNSICANLILRLPLLLSLLFRPVFIVPHAPPCLLLRLHHFPHLHRRSRLHHHFPSIALLLYCSLCSALCCIVLTNRHHPPRSRLIGSHVHVRFLFFCLCTLLSRCFLLFSFRYCLCLLVDFVCFVP